MNIIGDGNMPIRPDANVGKCAHSFEYRTAINILNTQLYVVSTSSATVVADIFNFVNFCRRLKKGKIKSNINYINFFKNN